MNGIMEGGADLHPARVIGQLTVVWLIGLTLPMIAVYVAVMAAFGGGGGVLVLGALALIASSLLVLRLVAAATAAVTVLGETGPGRWAWAVLVLGGGSGGVALGLAMIFEVGVSPSETILLGGAPYAVMAGLLMRGRWPRLIAAAALLAFLSTGVVLLRPSTPNEDEEVEARLKAAGKARESLYVVEIPGYRPGHEAYGPRVGAHSFTPENLSATVAREEVDAVSIELRALPHPEVSVFCEKAACETEPDGLTYRRVQVTPTLVQHGYLMTRGETDIILTGGVAVERDLLRRTILAARHPTDEEILNSLPPARTKAF